MKLRLSMLRQAITHWRRFWQALVWLMLIVAKLSFSCFF